MQAQLMQHILDDVALLGPDEPGDATDIANGKSEKNRKRTKLTSDLKEYVKLLSGENDDEESDVDSDEAEDEAEDEPLVQYSNADEDNQQNESLEQGSCRTPAILMSV
jgi:hypothetical protein